MSLSFERLTDGIRRKPFTGWANRRIAANTRLKAHLRELASDYWFGDTLLPQMTEIDAQSENNWLVLSIDRHFIEIERKPFDYRNE